MKGSVLITLCLVCLFPPFWACTALGEDFASAVKRPIKKSISIRQDTQKAEDRWAEEKEKLEAEFEFLKKEQEQLISIRDELSKNVTSTNTRIKSLETEIKAISRLSEELLPYLEKVFDRLAALVDSDSPFLQDERRGRIKKLRKVLDDSQVSISEKFRKVMEALFMEAEYGNTVEVYQERITVEGEDILTNIFRLGRLSLFFQSLDQMTTGYFDPARSAWKVFPKEYNREINAAIEIGAKRRPVNLLNLPLGRIVVK